MRTDLRFALRALRRSPVFAAVVILSLALGIGANTAIFSLFDQVLVRSLPVCDARRLVVLHTSDYFPGMAIADNRESVFSYPIYLHLRDRSTVFAGVIARAGARVSVSSGGTAERASAEMVSGNFFRVLGVAPLVGRAILPEDDTAPGAHPVVMLSQAYWNAKFGGDRSIVGRKILINGQPMEVVGVVPGYFRSLVGGRAPEVFAPITMERAITPALNRLEDVGFSWLTVFARLKPGVPVEQAQAATRAIFRPALEEVLARSGRMRSPRAEQAFLSMKLDLLSASQGVNEMRREFQVTLVALMGMVVLVLLIACANVAGLMTARAAGRRKEIAVRLAIGAGRWSLVRQMLVESLLLAFAGGALGLLVARWTLRTLLRFMGTGGMEDVLSAAIDPRVVVFAVLLSAATGILFGLVPALQASRAEAAGALKDQSASAGAGAGQARLRRVLVVAQVALSLLLLVGAGLFMRSVVNLLRVDPGFRTENVLTFGVAPTLQGYPPQRIYAFYEELHRRLAALPGVEAVSGASPGPLTHSERESNITVEGYRPAENEEAGASQAAVGPGYFRTIGVRVVEGREIDDRDLAGSRKVAIVNQAFVKQYSSGRSVIGRHLAFGGGSNIVLDREIVGVVGDFKHTDLRADVRPTIFVPYTQDERPSALTFYVRAISRNADLGPAVRRIVSQLDGNVPVFEMQPMRTFVDQATTTERLLAALAAAFSLLATLLAAIGLYGVIAYSVARRTSEIGVRMALGAVPRHVLALVMREVAVLLAAGVTLGLVSAFAAGRFVSAQLFGIAATDPLVLLGATAGLVIVALVAGLVPARRAAAIDPLRALRYE